MWPSDAIGWHRSGSTLSQLMACCLTAPSHHLNQRWLPPGKSCGIYLRAISQEVLKISILDTSSKVTNAILQPHLAAKELIPEVSYCQPGGTGDEPLSNALGYEHQPDNWPLQAWPEWPLFCRWLFQMSLLESQQFYFYGDSAHIDSNSFNWWYKSALFK